MSDRRIEAAAEAAGLDQQDVIRADIEQTRQELARTVDALGAKLDVKSRATETATRVRTEVTRTVAANRERLVAGGAALLTLVVGLKWWRRRSGN